MTIYRGDSERPSYLTETPTTWPDVFEALWRLLWVAGQVVVLVKAGQATWRSDWSQAAVWLLWALLLALGRDR